MSMMDHYPAKKRRLVLNSKTPTRVVKSTLNPGSTHICSQFEAPKVTEISLPKKKHKQSSPGGTGNTSTDDSSVEIGWDNNSPRTSQVLKQKRTGRARKQTKNSLSSLIKQIPKSRKSQGSETTGVLHNTSYSTWMQNNLATRPTRPVPTQNVKRPRSSLSAGRNSTIKGSKIEALDFNEEIKRFLSHAPNLNGSKRNSPIHLRSSPGIMTRSQAASPSYFSNSSADSLLEDSLLTGIDSQVPSKTPVRSCRANRTPARMRLSSPRITRSAHKQATRPVPALDTVLDKEANSRTPLIANNSNKKDSKNTKMVDNRKLKTKRNESKHERKENDEPIDLFDNEEIDELLLTQPDILPPNKSFTKFKGTGIAKRNIEEKQEPCNRKNTSTPMPDKLLLKPPKISTTPELFVNDLVDDDIFANFDMSEVRCKSQDTPPNGCFARLSEDQRKLKAKCHTSPLPLNKNQRLKLDKTKTFVPISKALVAAAVPSPKQLNTDMTTLTIRSPISYRKTNFKQKIEANVNPPQELHSASNNNKPKASNGMGNSSILENSPKSFLQNSMVTTACRKPFVPPKKQNRAADMSYSSSNSAQCSTAYNTALELSAIQGSTTGGGNSRNEVMDISLSSIPRGSNNIQTFNPFSSTQKCTMAEINEKRKFAQIKLRERLRRKRK